MRELYSLWEDLREDYRHNPSFGSIILEDLYTSSIGRYLHVLTFLSVQSPSAYSDALHSGLHRLCNNHTAPCIHAPTHATPCLFVYLFTFVIGACVAFFVCLFPLPVVSNIDRQQANTKSNWAHCIRRGLGRRLSSLLLNLSPRCDLPCRVVYLTF